MKTYQQTLVAIVVSCLPGVLVPAVIVAQSSDGTTDEAAPLNPGAARESVPENERIQFDQNKAEAHMRELEGRMYRLSELLRETQPDDADRLLLGLQKAREGLIVDRMAGASALLATLKLDKATTEQKEIIEKLEELKRLLLTADVGLQIKLQQLRRLQDARAALDALIRRETSQKEQTESLNKDDVKSEDFETLESGERRNERSAEDLEQQLRGLGSLAAAAAQSVGGATGNIGAAGNALGEGMAMEATGEQAEALEKLNRAAAQLAEAERNLQAELEALVRQQVMENLVEMIARQIQVREATEKLSPRAAERQKQALISVRHLADDEEGILALAEESIDLCELTEFSVAFPPALRAVTGTMERVVESLAGGNADETVIADEKQIEEDLKDLLAALKQASRPMLAQQDNNDGQLGQQGNLNKLLGELKMLRLMQKTLHGETETADKLLAQQKIEDAERRQRTEPLSDRQKEIRDLTQRVQQEYAEGAGN
jgi:hypothetical protein